MQNNDVLSNIELISARLLHDLAGSVGAIVNYIECLGDDESLSRSMMPLLSDASNDVMNKFKLLKQAYSISDDNGDFNSTKYNIENYLTRKKVILEWHVNVQIFDAELIEKINKLLTNMVMVLMLFVINGNKVKIMLSSMSDGNLLIEVIANAQIIEMHESIKSILNGDITSVELTTRNVQVSFLMLLISNYNARIAYDVQQTVFKFIVDFPL
ncbi:histidine phosphotransferase family protein [Ehrlichia ruminantium]|uniref:histidine phosphotransferase family protein n=1 Tax=Ehrlichia ruminantium TaxID=779 RepID=UPI0009950973|nr:histidine phosphotransferase family protein [Ehrlichia ruminantium]